MWIKVGRLINEKLAVFVGFLGNVKGAGRIKQKSEDSTIDLVLLSFLSFGYGFFLEDNYSAAWSCNFSTIRNWHTSSFTFLTNQTCFAGF